MAEDRAVALPVAESYAAAINVALVGGAQLYRAALRHLVLSDAALQIVAESKTIPEVLPRIDALHADVVVLDIDDASLDPLSLLEQMKSCADRAAILLLADGVTHEITDPLLLAGARGVVSKDAAANHLLTAIHKVHGGELWINRAAASRLIAALSDRRRVITAKSERARIASLSPREHEVVTFVADGLCNKAIAKKMGISDNTVRHHLTSVYAKLRTRDRLELVIYAFRQGIVKAVT